MSIKKFKIHTWSLIITSADLYEINHVPTGHRAYMFQCPKFLSLLTPNSPTSLPITTHGAGCARGSIQVVTCIDFNTKNEVDWNAFTYGRNNTTEEVKFVCQ